MFIFFIGIYLLTEGYFWCGLICVVEGTAIMYSSKD